MRIDTKEKYEARYRRRGERMKQHWARSIMKSYLEDGIRETGDGCKPNHLSRAVDIADCFPLLKAGHVKAHEHL